MWHQLFTWRQKLIVAKSVWSTNTFVQGKSSHRTGNLCSASPSYHWHLKTFCLRGFAIFSRGHAALVNSIKREQIGSEHRGATRTESDNCPHWQHSINILNFSVSQGRFCSGIWHAEHSGWMNVDWWMLIFHIASLRLLITTWSGLYCGVSMPCSRECHEVGQTRSTQSGAEGRLVVGYVSCVAFKTLLGVWGCHKTDPTTSSSEWSYLCNFISINQAEPF